MVKCGNFAQVARRKNGSHVDAAAVGRTFDLAQEEERGGEEAELRREEFDWDMLFGRALIACDLQLRNVTRNMLEKT